MNEPMILNTDNEAATFRTDISGWVSRHGFFYGGDEQGARKHGCTHTICECGEPIEKTRIRCKKCEEAHSNKRYAALEKKLWDGEAPLNIWNDDRYFWDEESLEDYCFDMHIKVEDLQLVICEPVYAQEIDPYDLYCDDLPEEICIDDGLWDAFEKLNRYIREEKIILSWVPGKYAALVEEEKKPIPLCNWRGGYEQNEREAERWIK